MAASSAASSPRTERKLVTLLVDLAGFANAVGGWTSGRIAELASDFYEVCAAVIGEHGGRVVKYMGDGCLARFDEQDAVAAVDCAIALADPIRELAARHDTSFGLGANIHMSTVVEGEFGAGDSKIYDVMGPGVIHTFKMGAGSGIRISEPVYRKLPSGRRTPWQKHQPPATYTLR